MTRAFAGTATKAFIFSLLAALLLSTVPVVRAQDSNEQITRMVAQLDGMIERTGLLSAELERAVPSDRAALEYRLDEVSIRALSMIDQVSRQVAELPEDDPLRLQLVARFKVGLLGLEDALEERLEGLNGRIVEAEKLIASLGGSDRVQAQAYSHNLRKLRARL